MPWLPNTHWEPWWGEWPWIAAWKGLRHISFPKLFMVIREGTLTHVCLPIHNMWAPRHAKKLVHYYNCSLMVLCCLVNSESLQDWYYACVASASCVFCFLAGMQPTVTHSNMRQQIELALCLNGITIWTTREIKWFPSSVYYNFFSKFLWAFQFSFAQQPVFLFVLFYF